MFRTPVKRLRALIELADDLLGDSFDDAPTLDTQLHVDHPHRAPLRWQRERRPGTVPPAPAHCLSPIRPARVPGEATRPVTR